MLKAVLENELETKFELIIEWFKSITVYHLRQSSSSITPGRWYTLNPPPLSQHALRCMIPFIPPNHHICAI